MQIYADNTQIHLSFPVAHINDVRAKIVSDLDQIAMFSRRRLLFPIIKKKIKLFCLGKIEKKICTPEYINK